MILLQQVKLNVIITNKNGNYKLAVELPNDVRLTVMTYSLLFSLLLKIKVFSTLARNY